LCPDGRGAEHGQYHKNGWAHGRESNIKGMRYLVTARVKPGRRKALDTAIDNGTLGAGSIAGDEYLDNMAQARALPDGMVKWVETCFCATPLEEERPYWESYFDLLNVKDAHARSKCRHENGTEYWACSNCDCTERLEARLQTMGDAFRQRRP
jgi:hypothetical protein